MKRAIAEILRYRTAWQLVAIAAVCTSGALLFIYNTYSSTQRQFKWLLMLLFGIAGAALILAIVRRGEQIAQSGGAGRMWLRFVAVVLGTAGLIAFATYSLGHHRRTMISTCNGSLLPDRLDERRAALASAEASLNSPFALLPRLLDDEAVRECERSRDDLARVEQGLCTRWTLLDQACICGEESYPYARCAEPNCLYAPGLPDRFDCPGDMIPDGYIGH